MAFTSHGSIVSIRPLTDAARDWIDDNVAVEGWESLRLHGNIDLSR
jgi:hypothetical protein